MLLLEAGGEDRNIWIHIPLGYGKHFTNPQVNWLYETEPEPECHGRNVITAARKSDGRLVVDQRADVCARAGARTTTAGASSAMSAGAMPTCCPISASPRISSAARTNGTGRAGRSACPTSETLPICDAFIAAAEQCGYPRNPDFNGAVQEGFGYYQFTTRNGRRCSTAVGYLKPARQARPI